ncbi:uncharacterized protein LOC107868802 [Capsicum annuum]|uniref:uncharacterized protein LOC107868802 n=1 Tax=Capsicum annuum TaxID=4072 RepID=UPI001FB1516B|nr:uncharacterized protein LOC107868802 [Capsicum annuum]
MRKVIAIDGIHLYGKYGGVLLSAVAQDTENHIFPVTFCVIDKENNSSWTFFFQKLKSIIEDKPDLWVISNRHIIIANVFSRVYNYAHHGLCMRHLAENLGVNLHSGKHLYLFYVVVKVYTIDEFSDHIVELKNNSPEVAHVLKNLLGFEKWSRATSRAIERHTFVAGQNNKFMPCAKRILNDNKNMSEFLYVTNTNEGLDQFTVFDNGVIAKVNLLKRSYFCWKFDLVKMSCEHAMAALRAKYGDGVGYGNSIYEYSSPIYKVETYHLAYSEAINIVPPEAEWTVPYKVRDSNISPPTMIANSEGRKSNALRASARHSSPKRGIVVQYARNQGTKQPHVEWLTNRR